MHFDSIPPPRVFFFVGSGEGREKDLLERLIALHPSCSVCPTLNDSIIRHLPALTRFPAGNATEAFPELARSRERILRAGFGDTILRFAGSLSGRRPAAVTLISASTPTGIDLFFEFFPMVPLVIVDHSAEGSPPVRAFHEKNRHYPLIVVRPPDLAGNLPRTLTRIFELVGLNRDQYPWSEAERAAATGA